MICLGLCISYSVHKTMTLYKQILTKINICKMKTVIISREDTSKVPSATVITKCEYFFPLVMQFAKIGCECHNFLFASSIFTS